MSASRRDHLVETATGLFERDGFHATGIDHILAVSGVAKMTLYNHFKSKEELIIAVLDFRDRQFMAWLRVQVERSANSPEDRLLAIFDALESWFRTDTFNGCLFLGATLEYADRDHPIHVQAAIHKRHVFDYIMSLAEQTIGLDARLLSQQFLVLYDGAISVAHTLGAPIAARQARRAAEAILDAQG